MPSQQNFFQLGPRATLAGAQPRFRPFHTTKTHTRPASWATKRGDLTVTVLTGPVIFSMRLGAVVRLDRI
jgi:hypothetical protein